jgi:hypothetical protein
VEWIGERQGIAVAFLSNREGISGGGNRCGRIDDGRSATEQLPAPQRRQGGDFAIIPLDFGGFLESLNQNCFCNV